MATPLQDSIRQQFGAALDALEGAVRACPDTVWQTGPRRYEPWSLTFHTLFWLDLYLSESRDYVPPAPFTLCEVQRGGFPDRAYTRDELLAWLSGCRAALAARLATIGTDEDARRKCRLHWGEMEAAELLLYNLRHVHHHTGQLNLLVRQADQQPGPWVKRADAVVGA